MDPGRGMTAIVYINPASEACEYFIPGVGVCVLHMEHGLDWRLWHV